MDPKRNIFLKCLPCLAPPPVEEDPEEYIKKNFGEQYSEYEYVIENLAITAVPKALLDEIPSEKSKKHKENKKKDIKSAETKISKKDKKSNDDLASQNTLVEPGGETHDYISEEAQSSKVPEDRMKKNRIFGAGGLPDIRYNPCYLHLCPDKNACRECKMGPDDKKDILRRMLLPPGQFCSQPNPLKTQVKNLIICVDICRFFDTAVSLYF